MDNPNHLGELDVIGYFILEAESLGDLLLLLS